MFGFNFSKQDSESQGKQVSGIGEEFKGPLSSLGFANTQFLSDFLRPTLSAPRANFSAGKYGVAPELDTAIDTLGSNLFSRQSGNLASRGFLRPENYSGVVGSAVREAAPALAPFAQQQQQLRIFGPGQELQQRLQPFMELLSSIASMFGGSGTQFSSGNAFGFGVKGGSGGGGKDD